MSLNYRPEIDGLRAVAVVPVVLYHAGVSGFAGGYLGVDIFFVISGFLITGILLADHEKGRASIWRFYERRARRILPALTVMLVTVFALGCFTLLPLEFATLSSALAASSVFFSNHLYANTMGYFGPVAEEHPLIHTWSLAVEEQFYLLFPLLLALLWRRLRKHLFVVLALVAACSLGLAHFSTEYSPTTNFFLLPGRVWQLLAGSLCAVHLMRAGGRSDQPLLATLGLALIIASIALSGPGTPTPSLYTLPVVIGVCLVLLFGSANAAAGRLLTLKPMIWIGLISYSLYLWHQPVMGFARIWTPGHLSPLFMSILIAASVALAWISWRFVEQPFRHGGDRKPWFPNQKSALVAAAGAIVFTGALGGVGDLTEGFPNRSIGNAAIVAGLPKRQIISPGWPGHCLPSDGEVEIGCGFGDGGGGGDGEPVLVWGDSHAKHLAGAFEHLAASGVASQFVHMDACPPLTASAVGNLTPVWRPKPACRELLDAMAQQIEKGTGTVILSSRLDYLLEIGGASQTALVQQAFAETIDVLLQTGWNVALVAPVPMNGSQLGHCVARRMAFDQDPSSCNFTLDDRTAGSKAAVEIVDHLARRFGDDLQVYRPMEVLCSAGECQPALQQRIVYLDKDHLTHEGSKLLAELNLFDGLVTSKRQASTKNGAEAPF